MDFIVFKTAVARQFDRMRKYPLLRMRKPEAEEKGAEESTGKEDLWNTYLSSFPAGTNPIYRERTEHDCSCCRQFIKAVGDVVAIVDGKLESIWDISIANKEPAYQAVADAMSLLVKSWEIDNFFLHYDKSAGTDKNFEQMVDQVKTWTHFFVNVPSEFVSRGEAIASTLGDWRATHDVMERSLKEIKRDAIDTVLELIAQGSLYRGEEHKFAVEEFRKLKKARAKLETPLEKDLYVWSMVKTTPTSVARIRNTSIGTLLVALSEGKELEDAVAAFESMVAPTNYKRPTALITKGMIEKAKQKLEELGLTSALERRYATVRDITVNNLLFVDRGTRKAISGDVFDDLSAQTSSKIKSMGKIEDVPIDRFLSEILPKAESLEVLFENRYAGNLVSLIAPADPTAGHLFKWPNNFSWSYNGEVTDSIKERVKQAGGNVTGDVCCRLAWYNYDDLDLHMDEPGGYEIYFGTRGHPSPCGGTLDVDMNAGRGTTREPVENIVYAQRRTMREGIYTLRVHNFCARETTNVGFEVEVDIMGEVHRFVYDKPVRDKETITVAQLRVTKAGVEITKSLPSTQATRTLWGLPTQTFHKVSAVMMSPNFWDERSVGNKHYFFMMDGCVNEEVTRGFYNEFLKEDLNAHRKVFEVVGSKMKVAPSTEQLSGLGFSSTKKDTLTCRVKGSFSRVINVVF